MAGNKKTMITPFIPLTTLKDPETQDSLMETWKNLPICTKLAVISFGIAKLVFLLGIVTMFSGMKALTIIIGFIYFFAVYASVFLTARDWLAYYMEEDKNLIHFSYPDDDGTSYLCNKRH
jgi:hypothetical protein